MSESTPRPSEVSEYSSMRAMSSMIRVISSRRVDTHAPSDFIESDMASEVMRTRAISFRWSM